ncbi:MAG: 50S ribosomal protein L11 methyltransferase, partial [Deltaproteobacteria bacterium]|nr:50S ribosomal protein L11 methyltransferase [Deltaproteobacteria bacterium]
MEDWLSLTISSPPIAAEAVSALLFAVGATGVWEDNPDSEGRQVFRAGFAKGQESRLMAEIPAGLVRVSESLAMTLTDFSALLEIRPGEDFSETWKKDLTAFPVGPSLWVAPTFKPVPRVAVDSGAKILKIDPGLAFGSGRHASTFLCLRLIHDLADQANWTQVLDVGAGSGVLALAAALLSPTAQVIGVDVDSETISVAKGNLAANGLGDRATFSDQPVEELSPGFDLILANLTLTDLTELGPTLKNLLAPKGLLAVSGLLTDQAPHLAATYQTLG